MLALMLAISLYQYDIRRTGTYPGSDKIDIVVECVPFNQQRS
jgi:hypothetical protein